MNSSLPSIRHLPGQCVSSYITVCRTLCLSVWSEFHDALFLQKSPSNSWSSSRLRICPLGTSVDMPCGHLRMFTRSCLLQQWPLLSSWRFQWNLASTWQQGAGPPLYPSQNRFSRKLPSALGGLRGLGDRWQPGSHGLLASCWVGASVFGLTRGSAASSSTRLSQRGPEAGKSS